MRICCPLVVAFVLLSRAALAAAPETPAPSEPSPAASERVIGALHEALAWYREARIVMRVVGAFGLPVVSAEDEHVALEILRRAFDAARAEAAALDTAEDTAIGAAPGPRRAASRRAVLQAAIERGRLDVERLRARLRAARPSGREAIQRELVAAANRLALDRAQLDFVGKLARFESVDDGRDDLEHQIALLEQAVPELGGVGAGPPPDAVSSTDTTARPGSWALVHRLLTLQQFRARVDELAAATRKLGRTIQSGIQTTNGAVAPAVARLRALATDPVADGTPLADAERHFNDLLADTKLRTSALVPLHEQAALVRRLGAELEGWKAAIDRESGRTLQTLAFQLVGVAIALAAILLGGLVWRRLTVRYVAEPYRRRLLLTARNVVMAVAVVLVVVFRFTSELAGLVTILGFAAAGIAFALQNVILAVAGYFSIVAPRSIAVGDRVSLQGPFGYVHGEVAELTLIRITLRELAGEPPRPTGRVVVFPNSVLFTGSFYKHPPAGDHATRTELPRAG